MSARSPHSVCAGKQLSGRGLVTGERKALNDALKTQLERPKCWPSTETIRADEGHNHCALLGSQWVTGRQQETAFHRDPAEKFILGHTKVEKIGCSLGGLCE